MIGFAMCGSFCTISTALEELKGLVRDFSVQGIVSETVFGTDTRFAKAGDVVAQAEALTGREVIHSIVGAEPLGPRQPLQAMVICPCTGNTRAKMACGITDTAVTMAAKAHLRSDRPLVIALASNDALSANLKNIGTLLCRKNVYFVPMAQDDPKGKPHSLVADFRKLRPTLEAALWCLLTTDSYSECVLKAVNLGSDTDTVAAVAGGLAGVLYGYDAIPEEWRNSLIKRDYIEEMCEKAAKAWRV